MEIRESLDIYFELVEDVRSKAHITYKLSDFTFMILCGMLAGCNDLEIIIEFAEEKIDFFKKYTEMQSIPCLSTLTNILNAINPEQLELCLYGVFSNVLKINKNTNEKEISIDGKTICSTANMNEYERPLHVVTALLIDEYICLGQKVVESKSNEIPAVKELLDELNVNSAVITLDALHCQKETVEKIIKGGGDYVIQLKANQGSFYQDVYAMFDDKYMDIADKDCEYETFSTLNKGHGRIEKRTCYVLNNIEFFTDYITEWKGLKKIFAVKREVEQNNIKTTEISCYISSKNTTAEKLLSYTRKHWQIESFHWLLDVICDEDDSKVRNKNSQINLNLLRKNALSIIKKYIANNEVKRKTIVANMRKCLLNEAFLEKVLLYYSHTL